MKQLRMRRWGFDGLPPADPRVRLAGAKDVDRIAEILTAAFEDPWDAAKVRTELLDHSGVPLTFVAEHGGKVAAVASYQLLPDFPLSGWVHWVGADPNLRGLGLGRAVVLEVLLAAKRDNKLDAGLGTDDFRLPAIQTYRRLGFEPDPCHASHPERWSAIFERLGAA